MRNSKNILFVGSYPPQFGGISSHLASLIPDLIDQNHKVTSLSIANFDSANSDCGFMNIHIKLRSFFLRNIFSITFRALKNIPNRGGLSISDHFYAVSLAIKIEQMSLSRNFDHIFIYTWKNGYSIPYLRQKFNNDIKIHLFFFGGLYEYPAKYLQLRNEIKRISNQCDSLISSSQYCADSLNKILGISKKVNVIYIGVDIKKYSRKNNGDQIRERFNIPRDSILILFFGRMNKEMGLDIILRNTESIIAQNKDVYIMIAGAKRELSEVALEISKKNTRVKYWENVPQDDKPYVYAASDILLSPTKDLHACMGVSIKEAMASGVPSIGSSSGGIPEAINEIDQTGLIAPIVDGNVSENEFIRKISLLINQKDLRDKISEKARLRAEKIFSTSAVLEKYTKIIGVKK